MGNHYDPRDDDEFMGLPHPAIPPPALRAAIDTQSRRRHYLSGHKRVTKTAVVSYTIKPDESLIFTEPSDKPTDHKVATWLLKDINFTPEYIHITWEWTVVE